MKYGQLNGSIKYVVFRNTVTMCVETNTTRRFRFKCSDFLFTSRFGRMESVSKGEFVRMFDRVRDSYDITASDIELRRLVPTDYYVTLVTAKNKPIIVRRINACVEGSIRINIDTFEFWGTDRKSNEKFTCLFELTYSELCRLCDDVKRHVRRQ